VWFVDLWIYYALLGSDFGEPWTKYSWLQLSGVMVLMYGTAIYNAPDAGSVRLRGEWYSLGMDFSDEYTEIQAQRLFSMGSYPSLQRLIFRSQRQLSVGRRATIPGRVSSPTDADYGTLSEIFQKTNRSESI